MQTVRFFHRHTHGHRTPPCKVRWPCVLRWVFPAHISCIYGLVHSGTTLAGMDMLLRWGSQTLLCSSLCLYNPIHYECETKCEKENVKLIDKMLGDLAGERESGLRWCWCRAHRGPVWGRVRAGSPAAALPAEWKNKMNNITTLFT